MRTDCWIVFNPYKISESRVFETEEKAMAYCKGFGGSAFAVCSAQLRKTDEEAEEVPTSAQLALELPVRAPVLEEHLITRDLSVAQLWPGYAYTLTPGQRKWLRDHFDMTPTQTVTATQVVKWKGTNSLRELRLESQLYVDERLRKRVLKSVWIHDAEKFFRESWENDQCVDGNADATVGAGKGSATAKTISLEDLLAGLEKELLRKRNL